ncbi:hypothetical protein [Clostridium butyricum]|uniref:hypothetical protein n=1 Tax=Clostridium butyricum TaxID=1492 RepID=UPI00071CE54D|nr:hypothetical protein [Clostridium butyricum]
MFNKKVFEVYLNQEGADCTIYTEINTNIEADGLITDSELEQIRDITLNICKRINIKNGDHELKLPSSLN